jgi:hypothetical protein
VAPAPHAKHVSEVSFNMDSINSQIRAIRFLEENKQPPKKIDRRYSKSFGAKR